MLKKILIIVAALLIAAGTAGYFAVNYFFGKILFNPSVIQFLAEEADAPAPSGSPGPAGGQTPAQNGQQAPGETPKPKDDRERLLDVVKSPQKAKRLEDEISLADKARAMAIASSVFSRSEISHYSAMVSDGITKAEWSQLMGIARQRFSSQQKKELLDIYNKYIDKVSEYYVEE